VPAAHARKEGLPTGRRTIMKLYHHTSATLLEAILDDALSKGHLTFPNGAIQDGVVWLTSDPMPHHHGLLDGTPLNAEGMMVAERVQGTRVTNSATHDKRQVRITLDSDSLGQRCVPFLLWAQTVDRSGSFGKAIGMSAIDGVNDMPDDAVIALLKAGVSREKTWYLVPEAILPTQFEALDAFVGGIHVPYDFEAHGRATLADHGLIYPGQDILRALPVVGAPMHPFDRFAVFAAAPTASTLPHVRFRGHGADAIVALDTECTIVATPTEHLYGPVLSDWVRNHRPAMEQLWSKAAEVARRYGAH
jgi:hypothetical protein